MIAALYHINQCALYKVGSKAKLAQILGISVASLLAIVKKPRYREFLLPEEVCPFTGKITKERWVQEPLGELRAIHERLRKLLMRVSPPAYAHAAVKGRSYRTNAEAHMTSKMVATFDITKFYPSTSDSAVFSFFCKGLCCPGDIAAMLATLVCYPPRSSDGKLGLPTGSPLSPVLSVYANKTLFDALEKIALANGLKFTCYVDDLTFSGDSLPGGLKDIVASAIRRYGHKMAEKKTRIFNASQAKHVTGVVLAGNTLVVPYGRFKKARRIESVLNAEADSALRLKLIQKLAGLLGEAAFLDPRYQAWARSSYGLLAEARLIETKKNKLHS